MGNWRRSYILVVGVSGEYVVEVSFYLALSIALGYSFVYLLN